MRVSLVIAGDASGSVRASSDAAGGLRLVARTNDEVSASHARVQAAANADAAARDALRAKFDSEFAAASRLTAELNELAAAERMGIQMIGGYEAALDRLILKHDATAAAASRAAEAQRQMIASARADQDATNASFVAGQYQGYYDTLLGVDDPARGGGSARQSALVFLEQDAKQAAGAIPLATHELQNLSFQANDFAMMLMSGQSFGVIMAQQGGQIAQIFGPRGLGDVLPAIGGALASLVTPTTMFLAGVTAAGYAGYYAFQALGPELVDAEAALKRQSGLLEELAARYGKVGEAAKRASVDSTAMLGLRTRFSSVELTALVQSEAESLLKKVTGTNEFNPITGETTHLLLSQYREFATAIEGLRKSTAAGKPDVAEFRRLVSERWLEDSTNVELTKQASASACRRMPR